MAHALIPVVVTVALLSSPAVAGEWTLLPGAESRPTLWADGREPYTRVIGRSGESRIEVSLADRLGWARYDAGSWAVEAGLAAGAFLSFEPDGTLTFALLTFDGLVALPFTLSHGAYTHTVEWSHISAHFADGIRGVLGTGDIDTGTYSRERLRWISTVDIGAWTPYGGALLVVHSVPATAPLALQGGVMWTSGASVPLCVAGDVQAAAEYDWQPRARLQVGAHGLDLRGRPVQVGLEGAVGPDEKGKWFGRQDPYVGVYVALGQARRPLDSPGGLAGGSAPVP